jgi:CheY-like chemotaxis protein/signal transduction histidine kinase
VQSFGPVAVPAWLWTPTAFHTYERHDYTAQAWYFGIATAMILFNALLFLALRDRAYLLYVAFASCLTLTIASQNGLGKEFLWQEGPIWSNIATSVGYCYSLLTLLLFMRHMLQTPVMIKHSDRLLMPLMGLFLISPVGFAIALPTLIKPAVFVYAGTAALVLIIGGWCVYQRQRSAYFFLAAFSVLCLAALVSVARGLGWLPTNLITVNALQFGSGLEMMLLAFALADRFNQIRKEKAVAQKAALVVQQSMVEALQASERVLEERVLLRTSEVTAKNAELTQAMSLLATVERIARHDLKTPLGSLAAAPDLLRAGRTMDPQEEKVLRLMEQAANHALQMVNLSLDFYRMESGSYRPTFVCVDLSAVVGTVIQDLAAQAASKEIEMQVADELAPVYAQAEEALCYSIIANLTKNAIEAAPTQSVVRLALTDGPVVRLCIHNLGAVPYALRDCFFDKHATEGKAGGTGLGTYSAALLTKAQQGSLTMETSDTDGTRLTLQLNRWEGDAFAPADAPTIPPSSAVSLVAHCQRVLVADDDEFNRMIVLDRLSKALTECRCAMNGREVLEIVHRWRPDLILMDIEMPLMGGFEALIEIRAFQRHAGQAPSLIVAYSGNDDPQSRATYLMHGFDDCMSKPGSQDAVLALLRTSGARARTLT